MTNQCGHVRQFGAGCNSRFSTAVRFQGPFNKSIFQGLSTDYAFERSDLRLVILKEISRTGVITNTPASNFRTQIRIRSRDMSCRLERAWSVPSAGQGSDRCRAGASR
jgi:hypothetical protein